MIHIERPDLWRDPIFIGYEPMADGSLQEVYTLGQLKARLTIHVRLPARLVAWVLQRWGY